MMKHLLSGVKNAWARVENPLMIKEIQQMIRSRRYVYVFMAIIFICVFILTLLLLMIKGDEGIQVGRGSWAFGILFFPYGIVALFVIPMTAFLSQLYEVENDCLELVQVTNLTSGQIVRGKMLAAILKLLIFSASMVPFFAFCYILRGISILNILVPLGVTLLVSIFLVSVYVFFAMLVQHGASKVIIMLFLFGVSFVIGWIMLEIGNDTLFGRYFGGWFSGLNTLEIIVTVGHLFLVWGSLLVLFYMGATSMTLVSTQNKAWPVRLAFLIVLGALLLPPFVEAPVFDEEISTYFLVYSVVLWPLFAILAGVWVTEDPEIPKSIVESPGGYLSIPYLSRLFLPGGVWGYHFTFLCCLLFLFLTLIGNVLTESFAMYPSDPYERHILVFQGLAAGYLLMYAGIAHHLSNWIRSVWPGMKLRTNRGIVLVSIVVMIIGPFVVKGLVMGEGISGTPGNLAFFNPFFVLAEVADQGNLLNNWSVYMAATWLVSSFLLVPTFFTGRAILKKTGLDSI